MPFEMGHCLLEDVVDLVFVGQADDGKDLVEGHLRLSAVPHETILESVQ